MRPCHALVSILAVACGATAPVAAQAPDPDLPRPEGWMTRFDEPDASESDLELFVEMPPGWHVTTGPAGIFWDPDQDASGDFRMEMEVYLFDPRGRREGFGVFIGGRDLHGVDPEYTYFLIRDGGQYIIKIRRGDDAPTIRPWTGHSAIRSYADRGDATSVKNTLAVEARGDEVRFFVNGTPVARVPRGEVPTDGIFGFRVNHGLDLHIAALRAEPL